MGISHVKAETVMRDCFSMRAHALNRYRDCAASIIPLSTADEFRRWVFAFASVHTTWQSNIRLYRELEDLSWLGSEDRLRLRVEAAKAGLVNSRTRYITAFASDFWTSPGDFRKRETETWSGFRDRMCARITGLGVAKSGFALELLNPLEAEVLCADTHILQLYGRSPQSIREKSLRSRLVKGIEKHWLRLCREHGIPPALARWLYWDMRQKKPDPRYWTRVLEPPKLLTAPEKEML